MVALKAVRCSVLPVMLLLGSVAVAETQLLRGGIVQSFPGIALADGNIQPEAHYGHAEIIACIETELNVRIQWQSLPTDRLLKLTRENQLDLIYPMGFTPERDSYLQASVWLTKDDDYFVFKTGMFETGSTAAGLTATSNISAQTVKDRNIGVKRGSPQQHYLQSNGYQNIHRVYDYQQLLPLLLMDRVDMLAVPQPLAEQLQAEAAQHNLQLYNYFTRDAGFYLAPGFARAKLDNMNNAVAKCRQHVKTVTAIK